MNLVDEKELPKELLDEADFKFNKDGIPEELRPLLTEIEHNKRKWKSLYMAVWGLPLYHLDPEYINKGRGDKPVLWGLPASKFKSVLYTPRELRGYLTDYDKEIHISQIIKIFTLLENYLFSYNELTKERDLIDFTRFELLKKYVKNKKWSLDEELLELELAKETRNCFMHRSGLIDDRWLRIYKMTGRKDSHTLKDKIPTPFSDLEDWTDIMVKIVGNSIKCFNKPTPSNSL